MLLESSLRLRKWITSLQFSDLNTGFLSVNELISIMYHKKMVKVSVMDSDKSFLNKALRTLTLLGCHIYLKHCQWRRRNEVELAFGCWMLVWFVVPLVSFGHFFWSYQKNCITMQYLWGNFGFTLQRTDIHHKTLSTRKWVQHWHAHTENRWQKRYE